MSSHYDALETRAAAERERDLLVRLPLHIAHAKAHAPAYAALLGDIVAMHVTSRAALARVPVTR